MVVLVGTPTRDTTNIEIDGNRAVFVLCLAVVYVLVRLVSENARFVRLSAWSVSNNLSPVMQSWN